MSRLIVFAFLLVSFGTSTRAFADVDDEEPPPIVLKVRQDPVPEVQPQIQLDATQQALVSRKSRAMAFALALGSTAVGLAMFRTGFALRNGALARGLTLSGALGATLGPSAGHFYCAYPGSIIRGVLMSAGRAGALSLVMSLAGVSQDEFLQKKDSRPEERIGMGAAAVILYGMLAYAGLTTWDVIDASFAARRANARSRREAARLSIVPTVAPNAGTGMTLIGSF
jgi:hypothetical protein